MPRFTALVVAADPFAAVTLRQHVLAAHPGATCQTVDGIREARSSLDFSSVDLLLTGACLVDGDVFALFPSSLDNPSRARRTLVVTDSRAPRLLASLRTLAVDGVFYSSGEVPGNIVHALQSIDGGGSYWSPALLDSQIDVDGRAFLRRLSPTEQLGLAVLGDGCGDKTAAARLGMKCSTVRSLRRDLHAKLGIHDREELIRRAVQLGFTRATLDGPVPLGLGVLLAEHQAHRKRPLVLRAGLKAA